MLVGGDLCKALLKQEIEFRGLFPRTSLQFVVGFVLWLLFFFFFPRDQKDLRGISLGPWKYLVER